MAREEVCDVRAHVESPSRTFDLLLVGAGNVHDVPADQVERLIEVDIAHHLLGHLEVRGSPEHSNPKRVWRRQCIHGEQVDGAILSLQRGSHVRIGGESIEDQRMRDVDGKADGHFVVHVHEMNAHANPRMNVESAADIASVGGRQVRIRAGEGRQLVEDLSPVRERLGIL